MKWDIIKLRINDNDVVACQAPTIISASRSTDIPAFYSDWLVNRIKEGYLKWVNPFNNNSSYISFQNTRLIIFWSKNPKPIFKHLAFFEENIKNFYFQFTLNDYDKEKLEPNVPCLQSRIDTFIELSERIGKDKVIWRFDPLILTSQIDVEKLLLKIENIGNKLKNYTNKLVFSFADITNYKKVKYNLIKHNIEFNDFSEELMIYFSKRLSDLNKNWQFEVGTCAEKINLEQYGILHNKCIDDDLIIKLFSNDTILMEFLGIKISPKTLFNEFPTISKVKNIQDKGQRQLCGCIISKDIGSYNTCPHLCKYCYANISNDIVLRNWKYHLLNPLSCTIF